MLQKLRDNTTGWLATVIIGLLIIPFAFVGLEQYAFQRTDNHVAQIDAPPAWWPSAPSWWPASVFWGHEQITVDEFRTSYEQARQQARAQQGEAFDARAFESVDNKRAILESLIDQRIQRMSASNAGVVVSDALMRKTIREIPAFQVDGAFNADRYQLALASQIPAQTPREFEQRVRESLQQSLVADAVRESNFSTQAELERLIRLLGEKRDVSLVVMPAPAPDVGAVSAAEIKRWYDGHATAYRAPETVSIEYVELEGATMAPPPAADEASLRQRYQKERSRFVEQEQRLASHILVRAEPGADAAAQETAELKATELAAQAKVAGADFAALARASSDDAGSKATGGDLGWVGKGMMTGPFEDALFAMKSGEISAPVKTDFGWHVIELREIKAGAQESFEQAREALAREQAEADRDRAFNDIGSRLVDLVYKNPSSLAPAARAMQLPVKQLGPFPRQGATGIAAQPAVQRAAFSDRLIQDGTVSDPIEIGPSHTVMIRVTAHSPERTLPLARVREQVIAAIRADRTTKAAAKQSDALLARLRAGEALDVVAASAGLPAPQQIPAVPRGAPVIDPSVSEAVFALPAPAGDKTASGKTVLPNGQVVLFVVTKVTPGSLADVSPEQRATLQQQLEQVGGMSDARALVQALRKHMKVKVVEANL